MTLALIAHDGKKDEMAAFVRAHRTELARHRLLATHSTGTLVRSQAMLEVELFAHGPEGGDVQIAALVVEGQVHGVFFFVEPRDVHPHDPDIQTLLRVCNLKDVPLATNPATGDLLLRALAARDQELNRPSGA